MFDDLVYEWLIVDYDGRTLWYGANLNGLTRLCFYACLFLNSYKYYEFLSAIEVNNLISHYVTISIAALHWIMQFYGLYSTREPMLVRIQCGDLSLLKS